MKQKKTSPIQLEKKRVNNTEKLIKAAYWDDYYFKQKQSIAHLAPSQLATFCLGELIEMGISSILEIAAGNGRDTVFFANYGMKVLATDNSLDSLELLKERAIQHSQIEVFLSRCNRKIHSYYSFTK